MTTGMADGAGGTEAPEGKPVEKDPILAEIHKRVDDAFDVFDHEGNKTVDVRLVDRVAIAGNFVSQLFFRSFKVVL